MTRSLESRLLTLAGHNSPVLPSRTILEWLEYNAQHFGEKPAVEGIGRQALSHRALYHHIANIGDLLLQQGIGRGDVVIISIANGPEALTAILAVASVSVALPVSPEEPVEVIRGLMSQIPVKAILFDQHRQSPVQSLGTESSCLLLPVRVDQNKASGCFLLDGNISDRQVRAKPTRIDDAAVLVRTAGTSAEPKLVAWSQASLYISADAAASWMELTPNDCSLCMMPFSHLHSIVRSTMPGLLRGGAAVCCPGFDQTRVLEWIENWKVSYMTAVPSMYRAMLACAEKVNCSHSYESLRFLATGSDRIDSASIDALKDRFKVPVREFYGMSEVSPMLAATPPGYTTDAGRSVGRALDVWSVACVDPEGSQLPDGVKGEIAVRGGLINPVVRCDETTPDIAANGWFLTGDRGWIDSSRQLHIDGRVDDRITRGGKKIAPEAVEDVLLAHPSVDKAVSFPVPDRMLGERVAAVVIPAQGSAPMELELRMFAAVRLPDYMVPERVIMVDELPTNRTGKVVRRELASILEIEWQNSNEELDDRNLPRSSTEIIVADQVGKLLEIDEFNFKADFMDLGGDSFAATSLIVSIEEQFGVMLTPSQFLQDSSIQGLAELIDELSIQVERPRVFNVQKGNNEAPLFIAHGPEGTAYYANTFAKYLGPSQTIYAFQWQKPELDIETGLTLEILAKFYVKEICELQPAGPYFLAGHSFGAQLAFEVAQQLFSHGRGVAFLGIIDDEADLFKRRFGIKNNPPSSNGIYDLCRHLLHSYVPKTYPGSITLFMVENTDPEELADPYLGWRDIALGTVERFKVIGDHISMLSEPNLAQWAGIFGEQLLTCSERWKQASYQSQGVQALYHLAEERNRQSDVFEVSSARRSAKIGHLNEEILHYRKAIHINRNQPYWVFRNLANALQQNGETKEALLAYRAAIELEVTPVISYSLLARLLRDLGQNREVEACLEAVLKFDAELAPIQLELGNLFEALGDMSEAEQRFKKVISLQPDNPKAYLRLSIVLETQGCFDDSVAAAVRLTELQPDNPKSWRHLGDLSVRNGALQEAETAYRKAIDLKSDNSWTYLQLSFVLDSLERLTDALAAARKAVDLNPDKPWYWQRLGDLLIGLGDISAATSAQKKSVQLQYCQSAGLLCYISELLVLRRIIREIARRILRKWFKSVSR